MSTVITSISRRKPRSAIGTYKTTLSSATTSAPSGATRRRKKRNAQARSALLAPSSVPSGRRSVRSSAKTSLDALSMRPDVGHAYWNASLHKIAPALSTTFGNFTTVNSVTRFTYTTPATQYTQLQFCHNRSALRAYALYGPTLGSSPTYVCWQQHQLNSNTNTIPLDIRPLRMTIKIRNTSQNLNVAGSIRTVILPQSLSTTFSATSAVTAATWAAFWDLVQDSPHSKVYSGKELQKTHTMVMPPSSYLAFNQYEEFLPLSAASDNANPLAAADFQALIGTPGVSPVFPVTPTSHWPFANVPSLHIMLVNLEPNPLAQTYDIEVYCQDAVRYPANSLAASMAKPAPAQTLDERVLQHLTNSAGSEFSAVSSAADAAAAFVQAHFGGGDDHSSIAGDAADLQARRYASNLTALAQVRGGRGRPVVTDWRFAD